MTTYYLAHHGIKGQRWGVRRYQNPDGSLTPAGKARYDSVGEAVSNIHKTYKNRQSANADHLLSRVKQGGAAVKYASAVVGGDASKKARAKRKYVNATTQAHKAYAKAIDAEAEYNAAWRLTKRGATRARQEVYRNALAINTISLTKNGYKQYEAVVRQSQTRNGEAITKDLMRQSKMLAYAQLLAS